MARPVAVGWSRRSLYTRWVPSAALLPVPRLRLDGDLEDWPAPAVAPGRHIVGTAGTGCTRR